MKPRPMSARDCFVNIAAGALLACMLALILRPVYLKEQAERQAIMQEWIREQRAADQAYLAEVEAERVRWEEIENAGRSYGAGTSKKAAPYNDPDIPDEVEEAARIWGEHYNISPEFLEAVAWTESRFDPEAENSGCIGLMQISPKWHRDRMERLGITEEDLWTVNGSMAVAADYLRELFEIHDDPYWVLMTYNGDSNADACLNLDAAPSEYALTVTGLAFDYTQSHEEGGSAPWQEE